LHVAPCTFFYQETQKAQNTQKAQMTKMIELIKLTKMTQMTKMALDSSRLRQQDIHHGPSAVMDTANCGPYLLTSMPDYAVP
jgi:hypothetical protein